MDLAFFNTNFTLTFFSDAAVEMLKEVLEEEEEEVEIVVELDVDDESESEEWSSRQSCEFLSL